MISPLLGKMFEGWMFLLRQSETSRDIYRYIPGPKLERGVLAGGPLVVGWGFQPGDPFEGAGTYIYII